MDDRLRVAAQEGNIQLLYTLIQEDPNILDRNMDDNLLADTPLHVAASTGNLQFAAEVMKLKPSYARKLNPRGLSPIHFALRSGGDDRVVEWFVSVDSNLVRDKGGDEGMTSLHYVIAQGNVNLLRSFLLACPDSIEDLTTKRETALHIALKYYVPRIFEALVGWLKKVDKEDILNWPDDDGNTILHMAISKNQTQAVRLLLGKKVFRMIKVNAKNVMGLTALDIFQLPMELDINIEIGDMLCQAKALRGISIKHDDPLEELEKIDKYSSGLGANKDMSQAVLTVAVLIATATFQAALSPPGGIWQDDRKPVHNATANTTSPPGGIWFRRGPHLAGTSTMTPWQFGAFYFWNSVTFYASMSTIRLHTEGHFLLNISQLFLSATYCCSVLLIVPYTSSYTSFYMGIFLALWLFHFFAFPLIRFIIRTEQIEVPSIFPKKKFEIRYVPIFQLIIFAITFVVSIA
ncbi:ankyrin repeat-containing protein BDA1-like [Cornus florida]|uniref:ankyrin repeat-containing protein BDA1-like n=1 Tax=Cornus florida TaxID=4283 RepID=UPI0028A05374|nr:ankyrin repeat-containing protein BDA1-like [Cornus florida]